MNQWNAAPMPWYSNKRPSSHAPPNFPPTLPLCIPLCITSSHPVALSSPTCSFPRRPLRPNQPIKQGPRQHEATQPLQQPSSPKLRAPSKEHPHVCLAAAALHNRRPHAECIYEGAGEQGEEEIEQEPMIRLQAKDAGSDSEQRGG
jgi:hypothetical protein